MFRLAQAIMIACERCAVCGAARRRGSAPFYPRPSAASARATREQPFATWRVILNEVKDPQVSAANHEKLILRLRLRMTQTTKREVTRYSAAEGRG
jgi:hypothetical protein